MHTEAWHDSVCCGAAAQTFQNLVCYLLWRQALVQKKLPLTNLYPPPIPARANPASLAWAQSCLLWCCRPSLPESCLLSAAASRPRSARSTTWKVVWHLPAVYLTMLELVPPTDPIANPARPTLLLLPGHNNICCGAASQAFQNLVCNLLRREPLVQQLRHCAHAHKVLL